MLGIHCRKRSTGSLPNKAVSAIWKGTGGALSAMDTEHIDALLFPNPTSGKVMCEIPAGFIPESVTLFDISGRRIRQETKYEGGLLELEIKESRGVYLVEITGEGGQRIIAKVVKL
jgi:hypothetical protein